MQQMQQMLQHQQQQQHLWPDSPAPSLALALPLETVAKLAQSAHSHYYSCSSPMHSTPTHTHPGSNSPQHQKFLRQQRKQQLRQQNPQLQQQQAAFGNLAVPESSTSHDVTTEKALTDDEAQELMADKAQELKAEEAQKLKDEEAKKLKEKAQELEKILKEDESHAPPMQYCASTRLYSQDMRGILRDVSTGNGPPKKLSAFTVTQEGRSLVMYVLLLPVPQANSEAGHRGKSSGFGAARGHVKPVLKLAPETVLTEPITIRFAYFFDSRRYGPFEQTFSPENRHARHEFEGLVLNLNHSSQNGRYVFSLEVGARDDLAKQPGFPHASGEMDDIDINSSNSSNDIDVTIYQ
eukprot:TRINITY_DN16351_c1_g1_i1.p1 TRINITY_DN16351_c1_g1~~TRINITY_DN16351_c1_g1_i1.p1  ORF type:complete len:351 (+),score=72.63 TRINITY_DN16351_c1_g1_i1:3-1055(+)